MKVHWCCGDVYLEGYFNIDVKGMLSFVVHPSDVEKNKTTLEAYYKKPFEKDFDKRERRPFIVDARYSILEKWPFESNSVEEIVMISCFEHFTKQEALYIVSEIKRTLAPGGRFIIDFPDIKEDIDQFLQVDPDYAMELIYCNGKDSVSFHKWGYTVDSFKALWDNDYAVIRKTIVHHDYSMIGMEVTKK